mmetsp:Transcript_29735/g.46676  ORF Transcript_29735/g.46676 Transcript_29735/m.46676 type:complete len:181 (-) Transcript_29735:479-1021(-)
MPVQNWQSSGTSMYNQGVPAFATTGPKPDLASNGPPTREYRNLDISTKPPTMTTPVGARAVPPPRDDVIMSPNGTMGTLSQKVPSREDVVMTPNGSMASVPRQFSQSQQRPGFATSGAPALPTIPANSVPQPSQPATRYDPDEAETRVRKLIADTERMLAGISGFSSARKNAHEADGVSV